MTKRHYHWQGSLDGMCGHYAIVNALTVCAALTWKQQQALLLLIWGRHKELYEGMHFQEMRRVLAHVQHSRMWPAKVTVDTPFENAVARRNRDEYLQQLFSEQSVRCAVIQIQRREDDWEDHWIVIAKKKSGRLQFIDSVCQDGRTVIGRDRASLQIGRQTNKNSTSSKWHFIKLREAVVFKSTIGG